MKRRFACFAVGFFSFALSVAAQTAEKALVPVQVPPLIQFSNVAVDDGGNPLNGTVSIAFSLYGSQKGGEPLWTETQNDVHLDAAGRYSVQLGITRPNGVPTDLFATGESRWLGVRIAGQPEQPRVLLVSVPYALRAGDAATIGGLPPSAFARAEPGTDSTISTPATSAESAVAPAVTPMVNGVTGSGAANYVPLWTSASNIVNSVLFQSGSGGTASVGINTTSPATTLDVEGAGTVRGVLSLPPVAAATATAGANSQPLALAASAFDSTISTPVNKTFQWQAEPAGNDKANPSGTLNLLFGDGATQPSETGMHIASNGQITFAAGQTFPGAGTITGVIAGAGLTGGGAGGHVTLNVDTARIPQLSAANTFTANQTVKGAVTATSFTGSGAGLTGVAAANSNQLGGHPPSAYALLAAENTFTGITNLNAKEIVTASSNIAALKVTQSGNKGDGIDGDTGSSTGNGIKGRATAATGTTAGVRGESTSPNGYGLYGSGGTGVVGVSTFGGALGVTAGPGGRFTGFTAAYNSGLMGTDGVDSAGGNADLNGTRGNSHGGNGVVGVGGQGVGYNDQGFDGDGSGGVFTGGKGADGNSGDGVDGIAGSGYAGNFTGNVNITGATSHAVSISKIDHPQDPANRYLAHAAVESSEMMNLYTGNVVTDGQGHATVQLPRWFEALNTDFRYQLTVIGQFAQAIVAREIANNRFEIRTSAPHVKVSWQVTGVRQDAYAKANPLVVEQEKAGRLRGYYIHPELNGAPPEKQIEWARHPGLMKRIEEMRIKQQAATRAAAQPAQAQPR